MSSHIHLNLPPCLSVIYYDGTTQSGIASRVFLVQKNQTAFDQKHQITVQLPFHSWNLQTSGVSGCMFLKVVVCIRSSGALHAAELLLIRGSPFLPAKRGWRLLT